MKKDFVLKLAGFGLLLSFSWVGLAQTHSVSTEPQKKSVLLEKYTGVGCGNCPGGAQVASIIKEVAGDRFWILSIHEGHYAEPWGDLPDYRTQWGAALLEQAGDIGYPQGSLNRVPYESDIMNSNRGTWIKRAKAILEEDAPLNLYMEASVDAGSREMRIKVELCYTSAMEETSNMLNIALVQNHILGYQNGANMGYNYSHEHMLRDLITGQWGDTVQVSALGQVQTFEYEYTVPDSVRDVEVDLRNIELVAFVTRTTEDVLNVCGTKPVLENLDEAVNLSMEAGDLGSARYGYAFFPASVRNLCNDTLRDLAFTVDINGASQTVTVPVSIPPYQDGNIEIPVSAYPVQASNTVSVQVDAANGSPVSLPALTYSFSEPLVVDSKVLYIDFSTDDCPDECSYVIRNTAGKTVYAKGPFESGAGQLSFSDTVVLDSEGIYALEFRDLWHDGWQEGSRGSFKIKAGNGRLVGQNYSITEGGETMFVNVTEASASESLEEDNPIRLFSDREGFRISNPSALRIERVEIFNLNGSRLYDKVVDVRSDLYVPFDAGATQLLIVRVKTEEGSLAYKLVVL